MVDTLYPVCQDDTENRSKHDDNRQGNYRRAQRRTGDKNKRHFYLDFRRRTNTRNDENGESQRRDKTNINQLYSLFLFRLHFILQRNKFHSRADFFGIVREPNETAEDVWTRQRKIVNLTTLHQPSSLHRSSYH